MISMASSSISWRTSMAGQRSPRMCSFSASPLPIPNVSRPPSSCWAVAVAWATITGWMRTVGQTTPVTTSMSRVAWAIAPSTPHTNGLWPWARNQGWKWSEIATAAKPARSASTAPSTSSGAVCSSPARK
jgi:hypothetical protein